MGYSASWFLVIIALTIKELQQRCNFFGKEEKINRNRFLKIKIKEEVAQRRRVGLRVKSRKPTQRETNLSSLQRVILRSKNL
jgi:hypothetical protein